MDQISAAMTREAEKYGVTAPARAPGESLWEFLYRRDARWWSARHRLVTPVLVLDQFEEIFTRGRRQPVVAEALQQFLTELRGLVLGSPPEAVRQRCDVDPDEALKYAFSRAPIRVIFSLREDYLAELLELRDMFPALGEHHYRLQRMSAEDARDVILQAGGHLVSPEVATEIVHIVTAAPSQKRHASGTLNVDPALLSVFCRELNNERLDLGQAQITSTLLQNKQRAILESFYQRSFEGLDPRVRVFVENELLLPESPERTSVAEQLALRRPGVTAEAIESLIARRLLRRDERDGPGLLELSHDLLIEPVRQSRDLRQAGEEEKRLAAAAKAAEEDARQALLLRVTRAEADSATAQAAKATAEAALRKRQGHWLLAFLMLAAVLLVIAFSQWRAARFEGARAKKALAATGLIQASAKYETEGRSDIALAYLGFAARTDPDNGFTRGKLLDALVHRTWPELLARFADKPSTLGARFTADGSRLITVAPDSLRVWTLGKPSAQMSVEIPGTVMSVHRSGHLALIVGASGSPLVWNTRTGQTVRALEAPTPRGSDRTTSPDYVASAAFDEAADHVAIGTINGLVHVWDLRTAASSPPIWSRPAGTMNVDVLEFNRSGSRLVAVSGHDTVRVLTADSGQTVAEVSERDVTAASFSTGDRFLLTVSPTRGATVWRLVAGLGGRAKTGVSPVAWGAEPILLTHEGAVSAVISPDGATVATVAGDGTVRVWGITCVTFDQPRSTTSCSAGQITPELPHRPGPIVASFSRDGTRLLTMASDRAARVWDVSTGLPLTEPLWHDAPIVSALFSPDAQRVVTATDRGIVRVWDVRAGRALPEQLEGAATYGVRFVGDGRAVVMPDLRVWQLDAGTMSERRLDSDSDIPLQLSRDGTTLMSLSRQPSGDALQVWKASRPLQLLWTIKGDPKASLYAQRLSADGQRVATVDGDLTMRYWTLVSGAPAQLAREIKLGALKHRAIELSADLTHVAVAHESATRDGADIIAIWHIRERDAVRLPDLEAPWVVGSLLFDAENQWLLALPHSTNRSNNAIIARVGEARAPTILENDEVVSGAEFGPHHAVVTSAGGTARVWGESGGTFTSLALRHRLQINQVRFSRDGHRIVTASSDGAARIWSSTTGDPEVSPLRHESGPVSEAQFSADAESLLSSTVDGTLQVWSVPRGTPADADGLASLAEAVSGYRVSAEGALEAIDPIERLAGERRQVQGGSGVAATLLASRVAAWMLADRWNRAISPMSTTRLEKYLMDHRTSALVSAYSGHPAQNPTAGGPR